MKKAEATIIKVSEHRDEQADWISPIIYFYPEITYKYSYLGEKYFGEVSKYNSKKYRVSEYTPVGNRRGDKDFFWRCLSNGDPIQVYVKQSNPSQSYLAGYESKAYASQNMVYLILSIVFALLGTVTSL